MGTTVTRDATVRVAQHLPGVDGYLDKVTDAPESETLEEREAQ